MTDSAIDEDSVVRLAPRVAVRAVDDENGYIESAQGVRRLTGTGLRLLCDEVLPRLDAATRGADLAAAMASVLAPEKTLQLLEGLTEQGIVELCPVTERAAPAPATDLTSVAVLGPGSVAAAVADVLDRTPSVHVCRVPRWAESFDPDTDLPPADLVVVATASLFEPWTGRVNEACVAAGRACLFVGALPADAAFAGPLWAPDRSAACFECLRTRIFANSASGGTWRAYTGFLAEAGLPALNRHLQPWTTARLAAAVGSRVARWAADPAADRPAELLWLDGDGGEVVRHLLPVPNCRVCVGSGDGHGGGGGRAVGQGRVGGEGGDGIGTSGGSSPGGAPVPAADLTAAVDDRVGIVHAVSVRRADGGPQIYLAGSTTSDYSLIRPNLGVIRNGGAGFAKRDALNATIGESLERYAAGLFRSRDLVLATWSELTARGEQAVRPDAFGLFSAEQYAEPGFPFQPFTADTPVRWTRAARWSDGSRWWLPASQVYLYYRRVEGEASIAPSISTGLAAADGLDGAVLGGLSEVLERDALAISWLHRLPPRPVAPETVAASSAVSHHLAGATSWKVRFYDLSLEFSPSVVVAVMEQPGGPEPVLSFGSACRISPVKAVEKAFLEAAQGLTYVRRLLKQHPDFRADAADGFAGVDDFTKHAILYTRHPELRRQVGYLLHPDEPLVCSRPGRSGEVPDGTREDPARVIGELAAAGFETYVADLSTTDTRRLGVHVCRVVVPGLQHLAGTHRFRFLGNPRLWSIAAQSGFDTAPDNPYPHPLP